MISFVHQLSYIVDLLPLLFIFSTVIPCVFPIQVLEHIGLNLEALDISGGFSKALTDEGLRAVTKHCLQLRELYLSLLTQVTCVTLAPIFQDQERAANFHKLYLSCREVSDSET